MSDALTAEVLRNALTAEVLRNALVVAAEEAGIVVVRSAYSTFIVEGSDASAAILDAGGRLIAHSMATTLMNSMALKVALPELVKDIPLATMRPGDVYVLNDAYRGGVHTNDLLVYRPVFTAGAPAYFTATMIHVSDLGGLSAGGMAPLATDIYLEGLQLPPVRLATADGLEPAVEAILRANSRTPDKVMGDVRALVAGAAVAATRIDALIREYGETGLKAGVDASLDYTETRTRAALAALPPGRHQASYPMDDDGINPDKPHHIRVTITLNPQHPSSPYDQPGTRTSEPRETTHDDRLRLAPPGRDGRLPGRLGGFFRRRLDGSIERLASKVNNVRFATGEAFIVETTGGGGIGPPQERNPAMLGADLEAGRVTVRGAAEDYGPAAPPLRSAHRGRS